MEATEETLEANEGQMLPPGTPRKIRVATRNATKKRVTTTREAHAVLAAATDSDACVQPIETSNKKRRASGPESNSPRTRIKLAKSQDLTSSQDEAKVIKKEDQKKARAMIKLKEVARELERVNLTKDQLIGVLARRCAIPYAILIILYII